MPKRIAPDRTGTLRESAIGELRRWTLLNANWDGEGAQPPNIDSLKDAEAFVSLLEQSCIFPEPMLNASGRAALYWKGALLYAEIEFLSGGRLAYYIEREGEKHKGVLSFDARHVPASLFALLRAK